MTPARVEAAKSIKNVAVNDVFRVISLNMERKKFPPKLEWVLALITGLGMALLFPPYGYYPLIWCILVPLFCVTYSKPFFRSFLLSYFSGLTFFSVLVYWLVHVTIIGAFVLVLYLALYFPLFICLIKWIKQALRLNYIFSAPVVWCLCEYLRGTVMTGFPWDNIGYAFYNDNSMIQSAEYIGVSGLSFIIVLANAIIFELLKLGFDLFKNRVWQRRRFPKTFIALFLFLACFSSGIFYIKLWGSERSLRYKDSQSGSSLKVALIQANIPQEIKWEKMSKDSILAKYKEITSLAAKEKPGLIIWPESSLPDFFQYDEKSTYLIFSLIKEFKIPIFFGGNRIKPQDGKYNYFNSAYFVKPDDDVVLTYDKMHLVPYGEYIPNKKFLNTLFPKLDSIVPFEDFSFGVSQRLFELNNFKFGASICFEDIFPELIKNIAYQGADFIVNITNDAWYKKTSAPFQHFFMAVFRAVENRTPFLRCSNTGVTGYVGADGRSDIFYGKDGSPIFEEGYLIVNVPKKSVNERTFYTEHGDIILYASSIISGLLLALSFVYSTAKKLSKTKKE